MTETLFGHLATRFSSSPENIAIEALGFVLSRSPAARAAVTELFETGGLSLPPDLSFATQATTEDDDGRPDIEAYGADLRRYLVIETKFWAGLTINQPLTYAARLSADAPGALVFILPSARIVSLWTELTKRLKTGGYTVSARRETQAELWSAALGGGHQFILVSWRHVLLSILRQMETAKEGERVEDVKQLVGLCERMDTDAFLPFRSEELTGTETAVRYQQFCQIVYDVGEELLKLEGFDRKGLTPSGGLGFYGRYLRNHHTIFHLVFDSTAWASYKHSPLWLRFEVYGPVAHHEAVISALRRGILTDRDIPVIADGNRRVFVPLYIPPGVERADILHSLVQQVAAILAEIAAAVPPPVAASLEQVAP